MSDTDIGKMDFKALRNEVQRLRDELALFRRKYEDVIYNLDTDNFSSGLIKEKNAMKAELKVTAEEISSKVSNKDFESAISQTADRISGIVCEFIDTAKALPADSPTDFKDQNEIYNLDGVVYYYNTISKKWEIVKDSGMVNSLFEQTENGFKLKGSVQVDGSCILTDSLTFNSSDRPLEVQYSPDCVTWYDSFTSGRDKYMQLKIGATWSDPMKIVGDDGQPGSPGSNATVTASKVFDILTSGGTTQGLFPAFYDGGDHLFINAEYIKSGTIDAQYISTDIAQVAKELSIGGQNINDEKVISFNAGAKIKTFLDYLGNPPTGLEISCSSISFDGLGYASGADSPYIYANNKLLATQDWVRANAGSGGSGGTVVAVFG